jgi:hypothetical protein
VRSDAITSQLSASRISRTPCSPVRVTASTRWIARAMVRAVSAAIGVALDRLEQLVAPEAHGRAAAEQQSATVHAYSGLMPAVFTARP